MGIEFKLGNFRKFMYYVFKVPSFDKYALKLLNNKELRELERFILELKQNPFLGKALTYQFLREKKLKSKRVYFLIYKEICLILLVATSDKKAQQKTIDSIKEDLEIYKKFAQEKYEELTLN